MPLAYIKGFAKSKYHEKCTHNTFSMPKAVRQSWPNHLTKEEKNWKSVISVAIYTML